MTAPQTATLDSRVSHILALLKNEDLSTREEAFADTMSLISEERVGVSKTDVFSAFSARHPDQAARVKLGLIQLLQREDGVFVKGKPATLEEEDGEYYAELIDIVASFDDQRAIAPLVGAMTTGGMAQGGLLKYGDKALGPVMEQLNNPDGLVRATALDITTALLAKHNDSASRGRVRDLIRSFLKDPDLVVRGDAVRQISCLDDRQDFVPVLEQFAKTDRDKLPGKALDGGDGDEFYPVRADARAVLRHIKNNQACTEP